MLPRGCRGVKLTAAEQFPESVCEGGNVGISFIEAIVPLLPPARFFPGAETDSAMSSIR